MAGLWYKQGWCALLHWQPVSQVWPLASPSAPLFSYWSSVLALQYSGSIVQALVGRQRMLQCTLVLVLVIGSGCPVKVAKALHVCCQHIGNVCSSCMAFCTKAHVLRACWMPYNSWNLGQD